MITSFSIEHWELREPFSTSQETVFSIETLTVTLDDGPIRGRGEALGVDYFGETAQGMSHQVMAIARELDAGMTRADLADALPPGGARNAIDCALWDLECKRAGQRAWERAGIEVAPVRTVFTLSLDTPEAMAAEAAAHATHETLKLKLDAEAVTERLEAVRGARPDARLLIDANGGWDLALLERAGDALARHGVELLEQPLPRGADAGLAGLRYPVPLCADESCQGLAELEGIADRYAVVNIKLDKCGGLTEALAIVDRARELGLDLMVGNMLGSSLAMAPAFLVAQACRWIDLDGPLWQRADRDTPIRFDGDRMEPPEPTLWG